LEFIFIVDRLDLEDVASTGVMVCSLFAKGLQVGLKLDSVVVVVVVVESFDATVSGESGDDGKSLFVVVINVVVDVEVDVDVVFVVDVVVDAVV